jgi:hypothetical protein
MVEPGQVRRIDLFDPLFTETSGVLGADDDLPSLEDKMRGTLATRAYLPCEQLEEFEKENRDALSRIREQEKSAAALDREIYLGEQLGRPVDDADEAERRKASQRNLIRTAEELRKSNKRRIVPPRDTSNAGRFSFVPPEFPLSPPPTTLAPIVNAAPPDAATEMDTEREPETGTVATTSVGSDISPAPFAENDGENPVRYRLAYYSARSPAATSGSLLWTDREKQTLVADPRGPHPLDKFDAPASAMATKASRSASSMVIDCLKNWQGGGSGRTQEEMEELLHSTCDLKERSATDEKLRTPKIGNGQCFEHRDCFGAPYHERQCANDEECQGNVWEGTKAEVQILRECLSEQEQLAFDSEGILPEERRLCERCQRSQEMDMFIQMRAEMQFSPCNVMTARSYVSVDEESDQYCAQQTFVSAQIEFQGTPGPVVAEIGYYYEKALIDGVWYHLQTGFEKPSDLAARNPEMDF